MDTIDRLIVVAQLLATTAGVIWLLTLCHH